MLVERSTALPSYIGLQCKSEHTQKELQSGSIREGWVKLIPLICMKILLKQKLDYAWLHGRLKGSLSGHRKELKHVEKI